MFYKLTILRIVDIPPPSEDGSGKPMLCVLRTLTPRYFVLVRKSEKPPRTPSEILISDQLGTVLGCSWCGKDINLPDSVFNNSDISGDAQNF